MVRDPASSGLTIVYRPIDGLQRYGRNSRTHTVKQIARLEASLQRFGWTNALLTAGDDLLAGHARLTAADNLRKKGGAIPRHADLRMVPTVDLSALSASERKAYIIADNKLAEDAGWDNDLLRLELEDLKGDGFDLSLTGFSTIELGTLFGVDASRDERKVSDGLTFQVVVECAGEREQAALLTDLGARGLKCRALIL
jgi:hypothetical protein